MFNTMLDPIVHLARISHNLCRKFAVAASNYKFMRNAG